MSWLLRSIYAGPLAVTAAILGVCSALLLDSTIALPSLDQSVTFQQIPLTVVFPLVIVIVSSAAVAYATPRSVSVSVRRHPWIANGLILSLAALFGASHVLTLWAAGDAGDLAAVRNVFGYCALVFLAQNVVSLAYAPVVPAIYAVVATIFGRVGGEIQPWAWLVLPASPEDALVAAVVAGAALVGSSVLAERSSLVFYGVSNIIERATRARRGA